MTTDCLQLNADYTPMKIVSWERAIIMVLDGTAVLVNEYAGKLIHSASDAFPWPAVIALKRYSKTRLKTRFSRRNVLARDCFTCLYCGDKPHTKAQKPKVEDLTIDHVIPRAQAVNGTVYLPWKKERVPVTCWENVVTACYGCNSMKADRTPEQAAMKLIELPRRPTPWDMVRMSLRRAAIPNEWRDYLPEDSAWREYWDVELDES